MELMSRVAKFTLAATSALAVGIVIAVYYGQQAEKAVWYSLIQRISFSAWEIQAFLANLNGPAILGNARWRYKGC